MFRKVMLNSAAVIIIGIFLLSFRLDVSAERSFYVSSYNIDVSVNKDGSADIEERLRYDFSGQFNGIFLDVDFSGSSGIQGQQIFVMKGGAPVKYIRNNANSLDYTGKPGTYNYLVEGSLGRFKIFEPSDSEEKTFIIKYKMLDAVTRYNDTAEFNRKVIGTNWQCMLSNVEIHVTLPDGASKDQLRVFAHGPLTGESKIVDGSNVLFTIPAVSPGQFVETLVLFPDSLVPDSKKLVQKDALPGIMENEQKLANDANAVREEARQQEVQRRQFEEQKANERARVASAVLPVALLFVILWAPLLIYIYIKYDREFKHGFEGRYYRELPGEYSPAEMSVLMTMGSVQTRDILATLLDLVRRKYLVLNTEKYHKKGIFGGKDVERYTISAGPSPVPAGSGSASANPVPTSVIPGAKGTDLKSHEKFLIEWFLGGIGNGYSVSFDEIEEFVRTRSHALQFRKDQAAWEKLVKEEADKNGFFDKTSKTGRIAGVLAGILYLILGTIAAALTIKTPAVAAGIVMLLEGLFLTLFSARINRRSSYGSEQHAMWLAFRNFLKDFSRMNKAEIPSIVIWEHYLVYAVSLGVAKEVIAQLPLVFNDSDLNDGSLTYLYGASYGYFAGFSQMYDNTIHAVEGAAITASNIANSSNSSGGGFGGGFSGGSSGGGGGGGGGGAF